MKPNWMIAEQDDEQGHQDQGELDQALTSLGSGGDDGGAHGRRVALLSVL